MFDMAVRTAIILERRSFVRAAGVTSTVSYHSSKSKWAISTILMPAEKKQEAGGSSEQEFVRLLKSRLGIFGKYIFAQFGHQRAWIAWIGQVTEQAKGVQGALSVPEFTGHIECQSECFMASDWLGEPYCDLLTDTFYQCLLPQRRVIG